VSFRTAHSTKCYRHATRRLYGISTYILPQETIMYAEIQYKFTDWERHSLRNKSLDQQRKKTQQGRYYFLLNKNEKIIITDINGYVLRFKKKHLYAT
jgi:hypothetical protein